MDNIFSIQIPRNFPFIVRLPSRFQMLVLGEANSTDKGTWYRVKIDGQELTILSQARLQSGRAYEVEKKSNWELKIVDSFVKDKTEDAAKSSLAETLSRSISAKHTKEEVLSMLFNLSQQNLSLLTAHLLYLFSLPPEAEKFFSRKEGNFYFETQWQGQPMGGVFKKNSQQWFLYLALPSSLVGDNLEEVQAELEESMFGLPIEKIILTSLETVQRLSGGMDIFG